jgi:hypothetical protein
MLQAVSMRFEPVSGVFFADAAAFARKFGRRGLRLVIVALGSVMMAGGVVLAVLPGHLGVPLLAVGLIVVLRNSPKAKRQFIRLQRRHPRMVFPVRRLIRREPEVLPVLWQYALRFEKLILPSRWRRLAGWRRRFLRARR